MDLEGIMLSKMSQTNTILYVESKKYNKLEYNKRISRLTDIENKMSG